MSSRASGYLAVDIGGTKIAAGIVSAGGAVLSSDQVPTPATGVWESLAALVDRQLRGSPIDVTSCGVGCGGPMQPDGELVSTLHIPEWRDFPLRRALVEHTGLPTFVANDAQAIVLGEHWVGALRGESNAVGMVVSTGVGGGVISDSRLVRGRLGNAGHIGHVIVEPAGRSCACGARGCLEAHASGTAIREMTGRPAAEASTEVRRQTGRFVGRALASVGALFDLRRAVIGGSVALGFGAPFFEGVDEELALRCGLDFLHGFVVTPVGLGATSPLIGAAAVARAATSL
ncbi:MAG: ROK family protein [Ilumatobacteraceae bacterium]